MVIITTTITLAAACSDEDVVDTIPPPRPNATSTTNEPVADGATGPSTSRPATTTGSLTTPGS